jgi:hypothetical protein
MPALRDGPSDMSRNGFLRWFRALPVRRRSMRLDLKWELDNECPDRCLCMFDGDRYTFPSVRSTPLRLSVKPPTKSNSVHEDSTLQRTARSWHARIPFLRVDHIVFSCPDGPRQDITTLCPGSVASLAGFQATTYGRFSGDHRGSSCRWRRIRRCTGRILQALRMKEL